MSKLPLCAAVAFLGLGLYGCQTSCGDKDSTPVLWADGIVTGTEGNRVYQTTERRGTWLHFPSYRAFRFPHNFGTDNYEVTAYVSLDDDSPAVSDADGTTEQLAIASGNIVVLNEWTENELVVENGTCENEYYLYLRIEEAAE
jgi:hypothetical protein